MINGVMSSPVLNEGVVVANARTGVTAVNDRGPLGPAADTWTALMAAGAPVSCPAIVGAIAGNRTGPPLIVVGMGASVDAVADMAADGVLVTESAMGSDVTIGVPPS